MAARTMEAAPSGGSRLTLGFGLVNVPVRLKPLMDERRRTAGRILCTEHAEPIKSRYMCGSGTGHEHLLEQGESATGYPVPGSPDGFVVLEQHVLDDLAAEKTGRCEIEKVVPFEEIDPVYLGKAYLCYPQEGAGKGFDLLAETLRRSGSAAVTTTVLSKQTVMVVFRWCPELGVLVAHLCLFSENTRMGDVALVRDAAGRRGEVSEEAFAVAGSLLEAVRGEFDPREVLDTYSLELDAAIVAAAGGKTTAKTEAKAKAKETPASDLMAVLKASLEAAGGKKPAAKRTRKKVAA